MARVSASYFKSETGFPIWGTQSVCFLSILTHFISLLLQRNDTDVIHYVERRKSFDFCESERPRSVEGRNNVYHHLFSPPLPPTRIGHKTPFRGCWKLFSFLVLFKQPLSRFPVELSTSACHDTFREHSIHMFQPFYFGIGSLKKLMMLNFR
jgi:hypothetical protein